MKNVKIRWTNNSVGISSQKILRSVADGAFTDLATLAVDARSYDDNVDSFDDGTVLNYKVISTYKSLSESSTTVQCIVSSTVTPPYFTGIIGTSGALIVTVNDTMTVKADGDVIAVEPYSEAEGFYQYTIPAKATRQTLQLEPADENTPLPVMLFQNGLEEVISWPATGIDDLGGMSISFGQDIVSVPDTLPSNITGISNMFMGAVNFNDPNVSNWDTSNVTAMNSAFNGCTIFNQPLNWNVANVTDSGYMFQNCTMFNSDISDLYFEKSENIIYMFSGCAAFNQPVDNLFNFAINPNITHLFSGCTMFNQPVNMWDTSKVVAMQYLFESATSFNQSISELDLSLVYNTEGMFKFATSFNQTLDYLQLPSAGMVDLMFAGTTYVDDHDLSTWCVPHVNSNVYEFQTNLQNTSHLPVWGTCPAIRHDWGTDVMLVGLTAFPDGTTLTVGNTSTVESLSVHWGDNRNVVTIAPGAQLSKTYTDGVREIAIFNTTSNPLSVDLSGDYTTVSQWSDKGYSSLSLNATDTVCNLINVPDTAPPLLTSYHKLFSNCEHFNDANISNWDTSIVTDLSYCFNNCKSFNQPLNWNTVNVTTLEGTFMYCEAFNQNINDWNIGKVTNMSRTFQNATIFNQPIGLWNTAQVTDMSYLFFSATNFNQQLNGWTVANATNMEGTFSWAQAFNQNISSWNTGKVTNMLSMFSNAFQFGQDISSWNTSNVLNFSFMLYATNAFTADLSQWCTRSDAVHDSFSTTLSSDHLPVWGTCPRGEITT